MFLVHAAFALMLLPDAEVPCNNGVLSAPSEGAVDVPLDVRVWVTPACGSGADLVYRVVERDTEAFVADGMVVADFDDFGAASLPELPLQAETAYLVEIEDAFAFTHTLTFTTGTGDAAQILPEDIVLTLSNADRAKERSARYIDVDATIDDLGPGLVTAVAHGDFDERLLTGAFATHRFYTDAKDLCLVPRVRQANGVWVEGDEQCTGKVGGCSTSPSPLLGLLGLLPLALVRRRSAA